MFNTSPIMYLSNENVEKHVTTWHRMYERNIIGKMFAIQINEKVLNTGRRFTQTHVKYIRNVVSCFWKRFNRECRSVFMQLKQSLNINLN